MLLNIRAVTFTGDKMLITSVDGKVFEAFIDYDYIEPSRLILEEVHEPIETKRLSNE